MSPLGFGDAKTDLAWTRGHRVTPGDKHQAHLRFVGTGCSGFRATFLHLVCQIGQMINPEVDPDFGFMEKAPPQRSLWIVTFLGAAAVVALIVTLAPHGTSQHPAFGISIHQPGNAVSAGAQSAATPSTRVFSTGMALPLPNAPNRMAVPRTLQLHDASVPPSQWNPVSRRLGTEDVQGWHLTTLFLQCTLVPPTGFWGEGAIPSGPLTGGGPFAEWGAGGGGVGGGWLKTGCQRPWQILFTPTICTSN